MADYFATGILWALENMVKILMLIFILIMLYRTINYNSDVTITFRTVFSLLYAD
jgi:hypothetical protein